MPSLMKKPGFWVQVSFIVLMSCTPSYSQEITKPLTAKAYWLEEQNKYYQSILEKKEKNLYLTPAEEQYYEEYRTYLKSYFSQLSEEEKQKYFKYNKQWNTDLAETLDSGIDRETEEDKTEEDETEEVNYGKRLIISNGLFGFGYGLGLDYLFEIEPPTAVALPFFTAGISMAWPFVNSRRYENINMGAVLLARHGKLIGSLHGAALGFLIVGEPTTTQQDKIVFGAMMAGSIALGQTGFQLGKKHKWSSGRVATYRYYGITVPALTFSGLIASNADYARLYGGFILLAGGTGYLVSNRIYETFRFTRGDMLAASSFGILSTGLGFGMVDIDKRWEMLIPAAFLTAGTAANHAYLNNTEFSVREGRNINYVSAAGVLFGLGISALVNPESHNLYFILPGSMGLVGWWIMADSTLKNRPEFSGSQDREQWLKVSLSLNPHHYFINQKMGPGTIPGQSRSLSMVDIKIKL